MAIPKQIHLCWFGNSTKSPTIARCLATIEALRRTGYTVTIWDERSYDVDKSAAVRDAYRRGKWSLVSNYARVDVLNTFGGIYLDTDIEIVRPFDDLLDRGFFAGFIWDCSIGTAVIGCRPGHPIIRGILARYDDDASTLVSPNNDTFTEYLDAEIDQFSLDGRHQSFGDVEIFDRFAFEHPSLTRSSNYTVHHFAQSWIANRPAKTAIKAALIRYGSLYLYRRYICWKSNRRSKFYPAYCRTLDDARRASARRA